MNAQQLAHLALINQRQAHLEQLALKQEAEDSRSSLAVPFAGYRNGKAYGRLPDGGLIEVEPGSNGGVQAGQIVVANLGRGGRAIGRWMPR